MYQRYFFAINRRASLDGLFLMGTPTSEDYRIFACAKNPLALQYTIIGDYVDACNIRRKLGRAVIHVTETVERECPSKCAECGENTEELQDCRNRGHLCESCADRYIECSECDNHERKNECTSVNGASVCSYCLEHRFVWSESEDEYVRRSRALRATDTENWASERYANNHWYYCSEDNNWYEDSDNAPQPEEEDSCLLEYEENVLRHCSYDQAALDKGALMFGVELEMEPTARGAQFEIASALGGRVCDEYILKADNSLTEGVELVTIPLTLEDHKKSFNWAQTLKPVQKIAKSGEDTENCGMHVHINKKALTPLQIGKMLVFLNSENLRKHMVTIAQREPNNYWRCCPKELSDGLLLSSNRYEMANVNISTVEIRMFRGNLRAERVLKNLEFCHALVTYCKDASMATIETWGVFASWLLERRSTYSNLVNFLHEKNVDGFRDVKVNTKQELPKCA